MKGGGFLLYMYAEVTTNFGTYLIHSMTFITRDGQSVLVDFGDNWGKNLDGYHRQETYTQVHFNNQSAKGKLSLLEDARLESICIATGSRDFSQKSFTITTLEFKEGRKTLSVSKANFGLPNVYVYFRPSAASIAKSYC